MSFILEIIRFLRSRRKIWLLPVFSVFIIIGSLMIAVEGTIFAPFIYTLF